MLIPEAHSRLAQNVQTVTSTPNRERDRETCRASRRTEAPRYHLRTGEHTPREEKRKKTRGSVGCGMGDVRTEIDSTAAV